MKIGIVGLGRMGGAIWRRLRQQGFQVAGWDIDVTRTTAASEGGLRVLAGAQAVAAESDVVISSVTEDGGARRLFGGPGGLLAADVSGKLFVEMSTLQPMTGRELVPAVEAKGARLIDAPVLGTIPSVQDGKLLVLAGGRAEDVERARIVLDKLARRVIHMGPAGSGYAMKLAVNLGLGAYIEALAESLALGARQGLPLDKMLDVLLEAPTATNWLAAKVPVLKGQKTDVTLDLRGLRKDVMSAVATGALSGVPMPVAAGTLAALSAAVGAGAGDGDLADLARILRDRLVQNYG